MVEGLAKDFRLEGDDGDDSDDTGREITPSLSREDSSHHSASNPSGGELGCDDRRYRIISANTDSHYEPPEDDNTVDRDS